MLASAFPSATLLICLYHTLRTFWREVTAQKLGVTCGECNMCLELMQLLAYSISEKQYQDIYSRFCDCAPSVVLQYVNNNWHSIRHQWTMGMKYNSGNFLNTTNNRLESLNSKLKSVISKYSSLEEFIDKFLLSQFFDLNEITRLL